MYVRVNIQRYREMYRNIQLYIFVLYLYIYICISILYLYIYIVFIYIYCIYIYIYIITYISRERVLLLHQRYSSTSPRHYLSHAFQKSHFLPKHPFWRVKRGWFYLYEIWSLEFSKVIYSFFSVLKSFSGFLWLLLLSSNYWYNTYILNPYYNNNNNNQNNNNKLISSLSLLIV